MSLNHPVTVKEKRKQYRAQKLTDNSMQQCKMCRNWASKDNLDRHHPAGRGHNILRHIYMCRSCHDWVHENPEEATEVGLLWPRRNTHTITDEEWEKLKEQINGH